MNKEQSYLIHLLSCAIRAATPDNPPEDISWTEIRTMADEQKILPLLFEAVNRLDKSGQPSEEIMKLWEKDTLGCTMFFAFQMQSVYGILNAADKNGMDMLVLKGMVLRDLYPVPELRTMSDCDLIIKKEQKQQVEQIFLDNGYEVHTRHEGQTVYAKEGMLKFEVFHNIPSGLKSKHGVEIDIWANVRNMVGNHVVKPSVENMLLHSVTHLMKHLRTRGAGVRNIADIILLLESAELDWAYLMEQLRLLDVELLFYGLLRIAEKYFDYTITVDCPQVDDGFIDRLMIYMLANGVYGVMDNAFILDARIAEGNKTARMKNYIGKIFPSPKNMSDKYSYAKKHPFLLPVAWIHRMFFVTFKGGHSVGENIKSMRSAADTVNEQLEILEYFNIK